MRNMNKKGQIFENISAMAIGIAVFAIVLTIAFLIIVKTDAVMVSDNSGCANTTWAYNDSRHACCTEGVCNTGMSNAMNASMQMKTAVSTIPGWISLIIIVSIGAIILMLVKGFRGG